MSPKIFIIMLIMAPVLLFGIHILLQPNCATSVEDCPPRAVVKAEVFSDAVIFSELEPILAHLEFDSNGDVVIDTATESILGRSSEVLPKLSDDSVRERIGFLAAKSFPAANVERLISLLIRFDAFAQARQQLHGEFTPIEANDDATENAHASEVLMREFALQEAYEALQLEMLGEKLTRELFGQQNIMARHILNMRRLDADIHLSDDEKNAAQRALEDALQHHISELN